MTPVDICNSALGAIGQTEGLSSLTDNSVAAIQCNREYDKMRKILLKTFPWNFAIKTVALTEVTTETDDTYAFVYAVPVDCLRVIRIGIADDGGLPVANTFDRKNVIGTVVYSNRIVTDLEDAKCTYISDVQDVDSMPDEFRDALSLVLATKLAPALSSSGQLTQAVNNQAAIAVDLAKRMCALERRIPQQETNRYIDARR